MKINGTTYFQQYRTCNKQGCKCQDGQPHGPYWFARDHNGRVRYVGKNLDNDVLQQQQQMVRASGLLAHLRGDLAALQRRVNVLATYVDGEYLPPQDMALVETILMREGIAEDMQLRQSLDRGDPKVREYLEECGV